MNSDTILSIYNMSAKQLAKMILDSIYKETGITATVGIGTNLYLAKIALDIITKRPQEVMVHLDENIYKNRYSTILY